jgi:hypothetical protein
LPPNRKYVAADWQGNPENDHWVSEVSKNIKFKKGFEREMFQKPLEQNRKR